ncbi:glycosyltransferase [Psychroserpens burtonensis]|uniref:Glycosyltransferase n=1 Tax=Psychroserpens burtonensis TaxID=49278 RepID=A0A5C7BAF4_9FLAO|nr:glycosyltransferase [Psychroserpens burtonensis]TXE17104.1 glycosyltransferase [Psychroserpens burtonensis]
MQIVNFEIISVGKPHWENGYVYALDACKVLKEAGFLFHYLIIGASYDIELQYQINDLELTEQITLMEQKSLEWIKDKIRYSDLYLQPSMKNGINNFVLTAIALETMVLTTSCGRVEDIIFNERTGFIVPIRNANSIAESIMKIQSLSEQNKNDIKREALETLQQQNKENIWEM